MPGCRPDSSVTRAAAWSGFARKLTMTVAVFALIASPYSGTGAAGPHGSAAPSPRGVLEQVVHLAHHVGDRLTHRRLVVPDGLEAVEDLVLHLHVRRGHDARHTVLAELDVSLDVVRR